MTEELDSLLEEIKQTEAHLSELRKEYREKRTANLREAIAARNEADAALREELKALGYSHVYPYVKSTPISWRNIA
jgi:uncharacterized protein YicC (UPF0701 family)